MTLTWIDDLLAHAPKRRALCKTLRLVRVPSQVGFKPGPRRLWFAGGAAYFDVFLDVRDGEVTWCQFTLRGLSLTWDRKSQRLQTEVTGEMGVSDTPLSASKLLYGTRSPETRFVLLALLMLEQAEDEPLFVDVAKQLRRKLAEPRGTSSATLSA